MAHADATGMSFTTANERRREVKMRCTAKIWLDDEDDNPACEYLYMVFVNGELDASGTLDRVSASPTTDEKLIAALRCCDHPALRRNLLIDAEITVDHKNRRRDR